MAKDINIIPALLVCAVVTAGAPRLTAAQIDSVGVFKTVRNFSDANKKELTILFTASAIAFAGCTNANLYRPDTAPLSAHTCQDLSTYSTLLVGYVAGLDPVESVGLGLVANFFFVGFIKYAYTGRWIDAQEDCMYDSFGWERRKVFCGNTRYAELGAGLILLNYKWIKKRL
jgi:hypothetical protein